MLLTACCIQKFVFRAYVNRSFSGLFTPERIHSANCGGSAAASIDSTRHEDVHEIFNTLQQPKKLQENENDSCFLRLEQEKMIMK